MRDTLTSRQRLCLSVTEASDGVVAGLAAEIFDRVIASAGMNPIPKTVKQRNITTLIERGYLVQKGAMLKTTDKWQEHKLKNVVMSDSEYHAYLEELQATLLRALRSVEETILEPKRKGSHKNN